MQSTKTVRSFALGLICVSAFLTCTTFAADVTPFKLGTFQEHGREFIGVVLHDSQVIDFETANKAYERRHPQVPKVRPPRDMKDLITRYESDLGPRLRIIAEEGNLRPAGKDIFPIDAVKVLPPVQPSVILNAGANYPEHAQGIVEQATRAAAATAGNTAAGGAANPAAPAPANGRNVPGQPAVSKPGLWERSADDPRPDNPYLFLKSPTVMVGANDDVVVPRGRDEIDWECEFAVVVGKVSKDVSVADASSHIFGYSIEFDVSDRENRGDRKMGGGPDWFVQKNHDTFAPVGPFIVPKEFVTMPMNTRHYFTLNGEVKQDSNTSHMEYNIWEMLAYASNVMTLRPGDLISMGTPPGTNIERQNPRWMKAGDVGVCAVEGVGQQRHKIVAEE
jgi:2-keto-4-pentenoate hydratase/2-oxohepta-3-ene-1,7-dioic acid hydratase in catechol pathway